MAEHIEHLNAYPWWVNKLLCPGGAAQRIQGHRRLDAEKVAYVFMEAVEAGTDQISGATCTETTGMGDTSICQCPQRAMADGPWSNE